MLDSARAQQAVDSMRIYYPFGYRYVLPDYRTNRRELERFIGSVQDFQRIYLTTEGAAGTYVPMLEMYYNLTKFNNLGMAAAMGLILFLVLMVATLINLKLKTVDSYE